MLSMLKVNSFADLWIQCYFSLDCKTKHIIYSHLCSQGQEDEPTELYLPTAINVTPV